MAYIIQDGKLSGDGISIADGKASFQGAEVANGKVLLTSTAINKVIYNGQTLIDISDSTVTAEKLLNGETAYGADGKKIAGTYKNNPYGIFDAIVNGSVEYIKTDAAGDIPFIGYTGIESVSMPNLKFFSMRNAESMHMGAFRSATKCLYFNLGKVPSLTAVSLYSNSVMRALVLPNPTIVTIASNTMNHTPSRIYVPDALVNDYKSASNWVTYAANIYGFGEAPMYDSTATYSIGSVCTYGGKCYGYCKSDLLTSVGNAPTGTSADNDYWEYIGEVTLV